MSRLVVAPVNEPLTLDQVKANSGVTHDVDDSLIQDLIIPAVRDYVNDRGHLALTQATWEMAMDCFPGVNWFALDRWPGLMIVNIEYLDTAGDVQVMPGTDYDITAHRIPPTVVLKPGKAWRPTLNAPGSVRVVFDAGFGLDWQTVPKTLHRACLMLASYWYAQREAFVQGTLDRPLELSVDNMIKTAGGLTQYA